MSQKFIGAIDQGTSSTRFMLFDEKQTLVSSKQVEFEDYTPSPGWVEHSPDVLFSTVVHCIQDSFQNTNISPSQLLSIGITNQRETTIVWDSETGKPLHNAIVWLDSRTQSTCETLCSKLRSTSGNPEAVKDHFRSRTGLPIATYFSALKLKWLYDNVPQVRDAINNHTCRIGTVDSWLIYKLSGDLKVHVTDVTNASRTMLMNIHSLQWDPTIIEELDLPVDAVLAGLPQIKSSSEIYTTIQNESLPNFKGVPISGCLGDQQAALIGQRCLSAGLAKNTYGTGCFLLMNTGEKLVHSNHGLLSTVAFRLGPNAPTYYALEGSIAIAGRAVQWLRDNLGLIKSAREIDDLAKQVENTGGVYFVPAFSGLFAPHWRADARGVLVGLTQYTTKEHIALATLQAAAFQTREVLEAMEQDSSVKVQKLLVDGGMTASPTLLQFQSDILNIPVFRPSNSETTALGAALAAGLASGFYSLESLTSGGDHQGSAYSPLKLSSDDREHLFSGWKDAIQRSFGLAK